MYKTLSEEKKESQENKQMYGFVFCRLKCVMILDCF